VLFVVETKQNFSNNPNNMRASIFIAAAIFFHSCASTKMAVPSSFKTNATEMHVKGLNGWMINQTLQFGNYKTSRIKRGWDFAGGTQYTKFNLRPEEMILRVFNIETDNKTIKQKNKFQYTIEGDNLIAEVYATESFNESQLVYKSNNPFIGDITKTRRYEYAFTAAILPLTAKANDPWSLVLINRYDGSKQELRVSEQHVEEEGYATNGSTSIAIRPVSSNELSDQKGNTRKIIGKVLSGYELQKDNKVIAMIDILNNDIWMENSLNEHERLIVSSVSSAILLKRIQDVQKDTDS
jgi:hypothetical protein